MAYQSKQTVDKGVDIPSLQNISEISSTAKYPLGAKLCLDDGRVFKYSKAGAVALTVGKLMQRAAPVANHLNMACAVAALGATTVTVTDGGTAFTANQYANGTLHINAGTGAGHFYRVKSHPANAGLTTCVITLYDPIRVALDATSKATMTVHKNSGIIVCPTTMTAPVAGVTPIAVTGNYYFWLQVKGVAVCLFHTGSGGAAAVGGNVCPSTTNTPVAGAVEEQDAAALLPIVGTVAQVNATTEYGLITLNVSGE